LIELIIKERTFIWLFMTDFMQLPLQAQGIVLLIFVGLLFFLLTRIVNWVLYVWAVCSMPRDERIKYLTRKKPGIEIPFRKSEKEVLH
jgi:hypothetical protein